MRSRLRTLSTLCWLQKESPRSSPGENARAQPRKFESLKTLIILKSELALKMIRVKKLPRDFAIWKTNFWQSQGNQINAKSDRPACIEVALRRKD